MQKPSFQLEYPLIINTFAEPQLPRGGKGGGLIKLQNAFTQKLSKEVTQILRSPWKTRRGLVIPSKESAPLQGGGVRIDATFVYSDLVQSSLLVDEFQQRTAAKVLKAFIRSCSRIFTRNKGKIGGIDGDRVLGIFQGVDQIDRAVKAAFQINYMVEGVLKDRLDS